MDPITRMAENFMKAWLSFRQSREARLFRIDADPSMHKDLWRLFRAIEMSPDNRSPYLMISAPFSDRKEFFRTAIRKLVADYELLKTGFAKDGVYIEDLGLSFNVEQESEDRFLLLIQKIWEGVKSQFEYLMIILLPERIDSTEEWSQTIRELLTVLPAPSVRLAVADSQEPLLLDISRQLERQAFSGRFFISGSAVQEYLLKTAENGWAGVSSDGSGPPDKSTSAQEPKSENPGTAACAQPLTPGNHGLPSEEAKRLRVCMARAAAASSQRKAPEAIQALREAQTICKENGLATHEAVVLMAVANSLLAEGQFNEALVHYENSASIARQALAPVVVMQARMGAASVLFHAQRYGLAAQAYEQAAVSATDAESEVMRIEALRMAGTCHMAQDRFDLAASCWNSAFETAKRLPPEELSASTFPQVVEEFSSLCETHQLMEQAKSVRQQAESIRVSAALKCSGGTEIVEVA